MRFGRVYPKILAILFALSRGLCMSRYSRSKLPKSSNRLSACLYRAVRYAKGRWKHASGRKLLLFPSAPQKNRPLNMSLSLSLKNKDSDSLLFLLHGQTRERETLLFFVGNLLWARFSCCASVYARGTGHITITGYGQSAAASPGRRLKPPSSSVYRHGD